MSVILVISGGNARASTLAEWLRESGQECQEVAKPGLFAGRGEVPTEGIVEQPDCIVLVADPGGEANGRVLQHLRLASLTSGIVAVGGRKEVDVSHLAGDGADVRLLFPR